MQFSGCVAVCINTWLYRSDWVLLSQNVKMLSRSSWGIVLSLSPLGAGGDFRRWYLVGGPRSLEGDPWRGWWDTCLFHLPGYEVSIWPDMCSHYTMLLWYKLKSNKLTDHELNPPNLEPRWIFSFPKVFIYFVIITQSGQSVSGPEYRQPHTLTSLLLCPSGWRFIDWHLFCYTSGLWQAKAHQPL